MQKVDKEKALEYHEFPKPGKIEVVPTKPYASQADLSLAYSPGVAYPCLEIEKNPEDVYKYTAKGNLVGVVSNGTAVLGLGDIGALAGKPVMEGKALLFKIFAGIDAFDIEVNEKDPAKFVEIVKALEPTFGGINLEDIKAPECFEIERRLKEECNIPVMHDDQHGTAIISAAGLINALEIQGKKIEDVRLVVNGAGAAAVSCTRLYIKIGVNPKNIVMCDSKGVIRADREHLTPEKREFATTRDIHTLAEAMVDADVFLGLSVKDVVTPEMLKSMAPKPIVFALANPDPEIAYDLAVASREDIIFATGRSDYPNQINNVLGFPYIFRGALDCGATSINEDMKVAAARSIAELAKRPVPPIVDRAYGKSDLHFGRFYILPKALDPRLLTTVAPAVAEAAERSGIARRPIRDIEEYREHLSEFKCNDSKLLRGLTDLVKKHPRRVVFTLGDADNMLTAASNLAIQKILKPVVLGDAGKINIRAKRLNLDISGVEIIDPRSESSSHQRKTYAESLWKLRERKGLTLTEAADRMYDRSYFGMMMVKEGDADAIVLPSYSAANAVADRALDIFGLRPGYSHFATMHILTTRRGIYFMADTAVNAECDADALVDITRLSADMVNMFHQKPAVALLSYSNFGSNRNNASPREAAKAVELLHKNYPDIIVDGEMQVQYAIDNELRDSTFPFTRLMGEKVNTLIFPNLEAANATWKMMLEMGAGTAIGPIQMGLNKAAHFVNVHASARDIENLAIVAAVDALVNEK